MNQLTSYAYDALDDLTGVCQGGAFTGASCQSGISRTFNYDSLKRLGTAQNPESGTIQYGYDPNGNLHTRQDARFTTTLSYDKLNRLIQKSYTDTNTNSVNLCYDGQMTATAYDAFTSPDGARHGVYVSCSGASQLSGANAIGRLTFETNGNSSSSYSAFDSMGRVLAHSQTTGGISYPFQYLYNVMGEIEQETYPSGRRVSACYDSGARPSGVYNGSTSAAPTYAVADYMPHGAINHLTLGNNTVAGNNTLLVTTVFDPIRLQPASITAGSLLKLEYTYAPPGSPAANNGNVMTQKITRGSNIWNQTYTYDPLNRLKTAQETNAGSWSETYEYDRYGNRWLCVAKPGMCRRGTDRLTRPDDGNTREPKLV